MEQKCGHCKIALNDENIAKDVNGEKMPPDKKGNYWCQTCANEIYEALYGEPKSEVVEGECESCGDFGKLRPFYNSLDVKQGDKVYCKECLGEMKDRDKEAFNAYYFHK